MSGGRAVNVGRFSWKTRFRMEDGMRLKLKYDFPEVYRRSRNRGLREELVISSNIKDPELINKFLGILGEESILKMGYSELSHTFILEDDSTAYIIDEK